MRLSPEYDRLSQIPWTDIFTLEFRGALSKDSPFPQREREEITSCFCSVLRSLNKERSTDSLWMYSSDYIQNVDEDYCKIQILYKRKRIEKIIDDVDLLQRLDDFLNSILDNKKVPRDNLHMKRDELITDDKVKYFFKIKNDNPYKHFIYSQKFIKLVSKF